MLKKDLVKLIENAKDDEDINVLLKGSDIETAFKGDEPTLDTFKGLIASNQDFKSYMDSENDKYYAKALKTMKEKGTWEKEFGEQLKEKYPDLITDPVQIELMNERKAREELEAKLAKKELVSQARAYAIEKGYKVSEYMLNKCIEEDLDKTKASLDAFNDDWSKSIEDGVKAQIPNYSFNPGDGGSGEPLGIGASMAKINSKITNDNVPNPWA